MTQTANIIVVAIVFYQFGKRAELWHALLLEKYCDEIDEEEVGAAEVDCVFKIYARLT